jgi:hypothetical protein
MVVRTGLENGSQIAAKRGKTILKQHHKREKRRVLK